MTRLQKLPNDYMLEANEAIGLVARQLVDGVSYSPPWDHLIPVLQEKVPRTLKLKAELDAPSCVCQDKGGVPVGPPDRLIIAQALG